MCNSFSLLSQVSCRKLHKTTPFCTKKCIQSAYNKCTAVSPSYPKPTNDRPCRRRGVPRLTTGGKSRNLSLPSEKVGNGAERHPAVGALAADWRVRKVARCSCSDNGYDPFKMRRGNPLTQPCPGNPSKTFYSPRPALFLPGSSAGFT